VPSNATLQDCEPPDAVTETSPDPVSDGTVTVAEKAPALSVCAVPTGRSPGVSVRLTLDPGV
jgi:hypothetical protein